MLNPPEYYYLLKPFASNGAKMLTYTIQDLCIRKVLTVEQKYVLRHNRNRLQIYLCRGSEFENYCPANNYENFLLKAFAEKTELGFYVVKHLITTELGNDVDRFKSDYVFQDLKSKNLCSAKYFPTPKGKVLRDEITKKLTFIDANVDDLITNKQDLLIKELESVGSNLLFLSIATIDKLNVFSKEVSNIEKLKFTDIFATGMSAFDTFIGISTFSFSDGFGGFDGFGGGDFGGAGAGGDW